VSRGFRDSDLHSFLPLDEERLMSPTLEEDVVAWTRERFIDIADSGLLQIPTPRKRRGAVLDDDIPGPEAFE
jgi:hypothetical protein